MVDEFKARRSINRKLGVLVLVSVGVALAFVAGLGLWQEASRYADAKREALFTAAQAFGAASAKAVAEGNTVGAMLAIRAIGNVPGIVHAAVEDKSGRLIANLGVAVRLDGEADLAQDGDFSPWQLLTSRTVRISAPIVDSGRPVGRIVIVGDTSDLFDRFVAVVRTALLGALIAIAVGLGIALRLQRSITRPLIALTTAMASVRHEHDFSRQVTIQSDDEIGLLANSFNGMMGEIRQRDDRLAKHREHLEQEVAERTIDLEAAKDAAETANAAKSDFLATMSHEIRTPMNGMLVMAELLASAELPDRQRRYAEVISRSGQSLLAIINDILDFAKVESGKMELERIPVDPLEVVDTVVTLFGEKAQSKGLDIASSVAPDVPRTIPGDPVRVNQVLSNLVNNALKFTETGHVLIRVALEPGARRAVRFTVEDSGIGIPADKIGAVFTAFSQADQSTTRRFGGTGLGLSICQKLVEAMGGEIGCTSVVGEGSKFFFVVPIEGGETSEAAAAPSTVATPLPVSIMALGPATRRVFAEDLARAGFEAAFVQTLTDARAPGIWIVDAASLDKLKQRPDGAHRILAIAAMGDASGTRALERGVADCLLRRPLAQSEWRDALARLTSGEDFPKHSAQAAPSGSGLQRFSQARILVADDSAVNREIACEALARFGISAETCDDGLQALDAVMVRRFDMVLMDGSMPVLDGFEATKRIRAHEAANGSAMTPVIALTAHVIGAGAEAWREAGMNGVLHKPFTIAKLGESLAAWLTPDDSSLPIIEAPPASSTASAPAAGGEVEPLLDPDNLEQLAQMGQASGGEFVRRIVGLYVEHAPKGLAQLRETVAAADADAVSRAAHGLKSMSLNIGATRLARHLAGIEHAAREIATVPDQGAVDLTAALLDETLTALVAHFADHGLAAAAA